MAGIKAILYDLDGVLVDACDWHYDAFNDALNQLCGFTIDHIDHMANFNALPTIKKLELLESRGKLRRDQFDEIWRLKQENTILTIEKNADLDWEKVDLHTRTRDEKIRSACVTNSTPAAAELMLRKTGQWAFMDFLIANTDVEFPKPHPEGYLMAIARMGLEPNQVLIVEDSTKGLIAARATGAHICKVKDSSEVTLDRIMARINEL